MLERHKRAALHATVTPGRRAEDPEAEKDADGSLMSSSCGADLAGRYEKAHGIGWAGASAAGTLGMQVISRMGEKLGSLVKEDGGRE